MSAYRRNALKLKLHAQLKGPRSMGVDRMEERIARVAATSSRRIACGDIAIAANRIAGGISFFRIVNAVLGMVEQIERLGADFKTALIRNAEVSVHGYIEICPSRIVKVIAASISKS